MVVVMMTDSEAGILGSALTGILASALAVACHPVADDDDDDDDGNGGLCAATAALFQPSNCGTISAD